jgi:hypothetical protein
MEERHMLVNKKKILLSLILVAVMFLPAGMIAAGGNEQTEILVEEDPVSGEVISEDDNVNIEKMDPNSLDDFMLGSSMMNADTLEEGMIDIKDQELTISEDSILMSNVNVNSQYNRNMEYATYYPISDQMTTRASDDEPESQDFVNGSELVNYFEEVTGSLTHAAANADSVDWYQLVLDDIQSNPGGTMRNVSFTLTSYTGDDLEEFQPDENNPGDIAGDYGDFLIMTVLYFDPFLGMQFIGGTNFNYDNQIDDDGWVWDGDNDHFPDDNYTFNFVPPIRSHGVNDPDGSANGLEESGFYYIGIFQNWYIDGGSPATRPGFTANYIFEVDSRTTQANDQAGADLENATTPYTTQDIRFDSRYNRVDWYKVQGNDMDKLWNVSYSFNWTGTNGGQGQYLYDPWTYLYFFWPWEGRDGEWDTDDDGWWFRVVHYSLFGVGSQANPAIPNTAQFPVPYRSYVHMRDLDAPTREFYFAVIIEPETFGVSGGQISGQFYPDWVALSEVNFQITIGEYTNNNAPEIRDVTITTKNPGGIELNPPTGGYYDTEFTIEVTYVDEDDDEPTNIWLVIDPDTPYENIVNIKEPAEGGGPKDPFDNDYTDADPTPGRVYWIKIMGEDLRDNPSPHQIRVNATDFKPTGNIRQPITSAEFYLNDTLEVWNDEPVGLNPNFPGVTPLYEDDPMKVIAIENLNGDGMFDDPEDDFQGFEIWNGTEGNEEWMDNYDSDLLHIEIEEYEGVWSALVTPKLNEHGTESVRIRGFDEHSQVNMSVSITVQGLNDPPEVLHLLIGGSEVEVNNADPLRPVARLESRDDVKEDSAFEFQIVAQDTDKEEDWGDLEFSYVRTQSDQWEGEIDVEWDTGIVTFTPLNEDVKAGNSKMVFSVDDHGEEGDIRLEVYFDVINENDPPKIQIPSTTPYNYDQEDRITINPVATDEDKGDTLTYKVNMEEKIGDVDSVVDQLSSEADIQKGKNWEINAATGNFWFTIDDQNIWKTADGMADSVEITVVFQAVDGDGDSDSQQIILTLNDVNEPPEKPDSISYEIADEDPDTEGDQGFTVTFSVEEVTDPDEDVLTYRWEFGDGQTGTGITVDHTYANEGYKTIQMYVDDGEYPTEKISVMINIVAPETGGDDDDDDTDPIPTTSGGDDGFPIWIIIAIGAVFLILIVVILAFVALRKKPAPAAQQMYPGYDQAALQGYQAQGLPPGQVDQLPPVETPGLPPAQEGEMPPENLPPVDPGMAPEAQPQAPAAAPEAPPAQPEMAAAPAEAPPAAGLGCPSCGSPVDPSWFLCPNCKAPLQ